MVPRYLYLVPKIHFIAVYNMAKLQNYFGPKFPWNESSDYQGDYYINLNIFKMAPILSHLLFLVFHKCLNRLIRSMSFTLWFFIILFIIILFLLFHLLLSFIIFYYLFTMARIQVTRICDSELIWYVECLNSDFRILYWIW